MFNCLSVSDTCIGDNKCSCDECLCDRLVIRSLMQLQLGCTCASSHTLHHRHTIVADDDTENALDISLLSVSDAGNWKKIHCIDDAR